MLYALYCLFERRLRELICRYNSRLFQHSGFFADQSHLEDRVAHVANSLECDHGRSLSDRTFDTSRKVAYSVHVGGYVSSRYPIVIVQAYVYPLVMVG